MVDDTGQPERPRVEPEIIPPDRPQRRSDWRQPVWPPYTYSRMGGTHRVSVMRVGPFGVALLMALFAVLAGVILLAILGAVLIWIPVVALLVLIAAIYRRLRW